MQELVSHELISKPNCNDLVDSLAVQSKNELCSTGSGEDERERSATSMATPLNSFSYGSLRVIVI
jgi:hypothetical protein